MFLVIDFWVRMISPVESELLLLVLSKVPYGTIVNMYVYVGDDDRCFYSAVNHTKNTMWYEFNPYAALLGKSVRKVRV